MTSGSIAELNGHLFSALDRLSKDGLSGQALADEVSRAEAVVAVADQINESNRTAIMAARLYGEHGDKVLGMLPQVGARAGKLIEGKAE